jgi:MYXO-CTERM domain-containing protein
MKLYLSLAFSVVAALLAPAAFPCGAPFGTGINVDPKQDIVVVHKDGVETYVFQPRFCGTASDFGLILPVPSKLSAAPTLSKASVFTQVDKLSQPEYRTQTLCDTGGRTGSAGGTGSSGLANGGGATVVSSGTVGFMDYTQLKADTTASFTDWLDKNGYPYDTLAKDAFAYYVDKGWYLLAFKISQGTVSAGTTVCKDLGPVKFSFPSQVPVVPTRMATARNRDASGALAYASSFTWRIFGITKGDKQLAFTDGTDYRRMLGYSGQLKEADLAPLDGLAEIADRLDRLSIGFDYGSKEADVALSLGSGVDFREVITTYSYVKCPDASVPDAPAKADSSLPVDAMPVFVDALPPSARDAEAVRLDAAPRMDAEQQPIHSPHDGGVARDSATHPVLADASVSNSAPRDAARPPNAEEPSERKSSGGCSMASGPAEHGLGAILALVLAVALRPRRRR